MKVLSPVPIDLWRRAYRADPTALVTQSPEWHEALCGSQRFRDASRAYLIGDDAFVVPAVAWRTGPLTSLVSMPESWGMGGIVGTRPVDGSLVAAVMNDIATAGIHLVRIRPNPLQASAWTAAAASGAISIARRGHVIDLTEGFEWEGRFHSSARRKVRKAESLGVEAVLHAPGEGIDTFYALFERSLRRWAVRQNEPAWLAVARGRRRDPIEKFSRMASLLGDSFRLWTASVDGQPAASLIVLQGGNAHYTRGAIDEELSGRTGAAYLLQRLAIEDAAASGCRSYHMGETGESEGLARFKEQLGAEAHRYAEYRLERVPATKVDAALRATVKRVIGFRDA